jgi:tetratricopeptide (TPR) repeat protein
MVAEERFLEARAAGAAEPVVLGHLNAALAAYQQALGLIPAGDAQDLAGIHNQLGNIYLEAGDTRQALHHYQQAVAHHEARGDTYGAGITRHNIALLLERGGRPGDALHYARAALHDYEHTGPGAAENAAVARELIANLEQHIG